MARPAGESSPGRGPAERVLRAEQAIEGGAAARVARAARGGNPASRVAAAAHGFTGAHDAIAQRVHNAIPGAGSGAPHGGGVIPIPPQPTE